MQLEQWTAAMKTLCLFFGLIVFFPANVYADSNYSYEDRLISALDLFLSQDYIASESKLKKLINERSSIYAEANFKINCETLTKNMIVKNIIELYEKN